MKAKIHYQNQLWKFLTVVLVYFVLSGCASSRYTVLEPAKEPLTNFEVLEISDFTSNLSDEDSVELASRFADRLYVAVMTEREQNPGESFFKDVVRSTDESTSVLVLEGTVISFEKGSRAKRYFIGFGAGKAYCTIRASFTNKETGQEILQTNFDGELSMSFFGGSPDEAVDAVVRAFIDYFDDYFEN
jgi:hypothetical protein